MSIITEYTYDDYVFSDTTDYSGLRDFLSDDLTNLNTQIGRYVFNTNIVLSNGDVFYKVFTCICKNIIISLCTHNITETQKEQYIAFTQLNINTERCEITKIHALRLEIPSNIDSTDMRVGINGVYLMGLVQNIFLLPSKSFFLAGIHKDATTVTDLNVLWFNYPTWFKDN